MRGTPGTFILMYHKISDSPTTNLHTLSGDRFRTQVRYLAQSGYPVLPWNQMALDAGSCGDRPCVGITFDDGFKSDLDSARFLHERGMTALFFISTANIGKPDYLTEDNVRELHGLGMGVGSHSHHHVRLTTLNEGEAERELRTSREILEALIGTPVEHMSFPGGAYNARLLDIARKAGFRYLYTSDWGINRVRQTASGVLRRTGLLGTSRVAHIEDLLGMRHYYARQIGFYGKETVKRMLGAQGFYGLRKVLMRLNVR